MDKSNRNGDLSHTFRRIICYFLTLVMSACVVLSISVGIASGLLRTESFVQKRYEKYNSQLLEEVNNAVEGIADITGLPAKAYTSSIQEMHTITALRQAANNAVRGFDTDYTKSEYLYGYYHTGLYNFCKDNGIPITEEELVKDACFAVDIFNDTVGDESTSSILLFAFTYTKKPLVWILLSVVIFILSLIIIDFISFGIHKKFDYLGMSLIIAGEVQIILPLFAILMKYTSTLRFMDVDVYNMAFADVLDDILKIIMAVGAAILVIGITIIVFNYRYYKHKTNQLKTEHDIRLKLVEEQKQYIDTLAQAEKEADIIQNEIELNDREINE